MRAYSKDEAKVFRRVAMKVHRYRRVLGEIQEAVMEKFAAAEFLGGSGEEFVDGADHILRFMGSFDSLHSLGWDHDTTAVVLDSAAQISSTIAKIAWEVSLE